MDTQLTLLNGGVTPEPEMQRSLFADSGMDADGEGGADGGGVRDGDGERDASAAAPTATRRRRSGSTPSANSNAARDAVRRTGGLVLVDAVYAPDSGAPVCSRCWSSPQVQRYTRGARGAPRGWGAASTSAFETVGGVKVTVIRTIYRCSNAECDTAIALHMLVTGGYVPSLVEERRLADDAAARFRRGKLRRDGVWVSREGFPKTAREQMEML